VAHPDVDHPDEDSDDALSSFGEAVFALFRDPRPDNIDRYLVASLALDRQLAAERRRAS
jgi:hypothetical protein